MSPAASTVSGLMSRNPAEIARVLEKAKREKVPVRVFFPGLSYEGHILLVDPANGRLVLSRGAREAANAALLARPRCTFHCEMAGWHIEFVAGAPRAVAHRGKQLIECRFPDILASNPRRGHERVEAKPPLVLRVEADAGGIMPFDARIVDLAAEGLGFLLYAESITLEPGTVLRGCRIQPPGAAVCIADLEVRYSVPVVLPNGRRVMRSGCRFVAPGSPDVAALLRRFLKR